MLKPFKFSALIFKSRGIEASLFGSSRIKGPCHWILITRTILYVSVRFCISTALCSISFSRKAFSFLFFFFLYIPLRIEGNILQLTFQKIFSWVKDLVSSRQVLIVRAAKQSEHRSLLAHSLEATSKDINLCFYTIKECAVFYHILPPWVKRDHFDGLWCPRISYLNCELNASYFFELNCTILLLFKNNCVCLSPAMFCINASETLRLVRHTFLSISLGNYSISSLFPLCLVTRKCKRQHFYKKKSTEYTY